MSALPQVTTLAQLRDVRKTAQQSGVVTAVGLLFAADWHPATGGLREAVAGLQQALPNIKFVEVDGDKAQDLLTTFGVDSLPTVLLLAENKVERIVGADVPKIVAAARELSKTLSDQPVQQVLQQQQAVVAAARQDDAPQKQQQAVRKPEPVKDEGKLRGAPLNERLAALINSRPVVLFMKGSPEEPRCGFSNKMVGILRELGVRSFGYFDILGDNEVREGLKAFSDWPTYPQLYWRGELQGGLDAVQEMIKEQDPTVKEWVVADNE